MTMHWKCPDVALKMVKEEQSGDYDTVTVINIALCMLVHVNVGIDNTHAALDLGE